MSKETGGFAFPSKVSNLSNEKQNIYGYDVPPGNSFIAGGMTLLDHFAGLAMQAIVRRYDGHPFGGGTESPQYRELAEDAYHIARSMLRARGE